MSRFAWLQFRMQAITAIAGLGVVAVLLAITGPHLVHLYDITVANCAVHGDCLNAPTAFVGNDRILQDLLGGLVIAAPGAIGVFLGAPLVSRELESGTFRLAWTQSVTRTRWVVMKLGVVGLGSMTVAGVISLMATWWSSPIDRANLSIYWTFDQRDIVPIGYAAFAFAFGALAGVLIRRTLPAMAVTLAGFVTTRLLYNHLVMPRLIAPAHQYLALNSETVAGFGQMNGGPFTLFAGNPNFPNAWIYSTQFVDRAGTPLSSQVLAGTCPLLGSNLGRGAAPDGGVGAVAVPAPAGAGSVLHSCITKLGATYHEVVAYQPAGKFWYFQWYDLAIYLAAAVFMAAGCIWWIRRRIA